MPEENHIEALKKAIRQNIGDNKVEQAYKNFLDLHHDYAKEIDIDDLVLLRQDYAALKEADKNGTENLQPLKKQICTEILKLTKEITTKEAAPKPYKTVVQAYGITKEYKTTAFKLTLPELTLKHGEITVLVGENATGKSTLLRILAGDLAIGKGDLKYPEFHKNKWTLNYWGNIKQHIAYIPQELPKWNGNLKDHLHYEAAIHGFNGKLNDAVVDYIIRRLGLTKHINKSWKQLSGGFKLRFSLAKALVWKPQLLIIDEPLAHLDVNTQLIVLQDLKDFAQRWTYPISIILSSQHLHETEAIAHQWLFMKDGHVEVIKDLNENNEFNLFELSCNLSEKELKALLKDVPYNRLSKNQLAYEIETPKSTTKQQLLNTLLANAKTEIHYFRDISQSIKTKFYEKAN